MNDEQFEHLLDRVAERLSEPRKKDPIDHIKEWLPIALLAISLIGGYVRLQDNQDRANRDIAELKEKKVDKDVLAVQLQAQNDNLKGIKEELVEIKRLSYPPSFTAFAPGTKLNVRRH